MNIISDLSLDSWGGALSFIASVAVALLPFFWKRHRKQKKLQAKLTLKNGGNLRVISDLKYWVNAEAKITGFEFTKGDSLVSKKFLKRNKGSLHNLLLAVVEFTTLSNKPVKTLIYIGDEVYDEGEMIEILYNPQKPEEVIYAG